MASNTASMYSRSFFGDEEISLKFPSGWEVQTIGPQPAPKLSDAQMQAAFGNPIGTPRISEMARGKQSAAIVVDDLSRPTPASEVIPYVLKELAEAGVPKSQIRFVVGGGSHRPVTAEEAAKKVGEEVAREYEVTSHYFLNGDLAALGNLPNGLPIYINRVVAEADFKICLGGIYPHGAVGFGGGAKLVVPGISGFATIFYFHSFFPSRGHAIIERQGDEPDLRDVAEAVAAVLKLDVIVNVVLNNAREVAGLFVGDFVKAHRTGAQFALETYATEISEELRDNTNVILANAYPLDADPIQTGKGLWPRRYINKEAYTISVNPACDGICYHGLFDKLDYGIFEKQKAAQEPMALPTPVLNGPEQLLMWSEHFPVDEFYKRNSDGLLFRKWDKLVDVLSEKMPEKARVAVFPCSGIQVMKE